MIKKIFILILSMIMIISCSKNNPNNPNNGGNGDGGTTTEPNKYDSLFLKFITDIDTVPTFQFIKDNGVTTNNAGEQISYTRSWVESTDTTNTCYIYKAPDGESTNTGNVFGQAVPVALSKLEIYAYRGINPFKTKNDNDIESQFYFYRYKGNAFVDLDNFLVAVDTKTGLVFPYAVPEKWETVVGNNAPKGWISAELGRTGVYGTTDQEETFEAHKFWQYDPIGQVNDDGSVTLEQFYIDAQKKGDYKPVYTGASPYKDIQ